MDRSVHMTNAFTVDLEDWAHGLLGGDTPLTSRVIRNVARVLQLLDTCNVRATFFALGKVCEAYPGILPEVAAAGHEIASHGYGHERVSSMTPAEFRDDVRRSIDVIGDQIGRAPLGYRAPQFSITQDALWAGPILEELGFAYSSSIFPCAGRRYGIAQAPRHMFRWGEWAAYRQAFEAPCDLIEFPMTTINVGVRHLPSCGGGWLRLWPTRLHRAAILQAHADNRPAVVYIHPYEMDVHEVGESLDAGLRLSSTVAFKQALFRSRVRPRLEALFEQFDFAPMCEVLATSGHGHTGPAHCLA